jgi:uncharacterized protein YceK
MNLIKKTTIVLALGLAASGCSVIESKSVAREDLKNAQGHVIGYKDMMRDERTGEELAQIALFVPRVGSRGEIVGYEERMRGGVAVLRDVNGKRIGGRYADIRSRGNNPQGGGMMIIVRGKNADSAVAEAPSIEQLIQLAQLN